MLSITESRVVFVIPAYKPGHRLVELVNTLAAEIPLGIIVVNDGSGPTFQSTFDQVARIPGVSIVPHAVNLGKGAALKTGFNFALCRFPSMIGVVTADADGQHRPEDIFRVQAALAREPDTLVLGVRDFGGSVPLRSKFGNEATKVIARALVGCQLTDTQTGLRGIPRALLPALLRIGAPGYEFELEMLIAARHSKYPIIQVSIKTIYIDGNQTSHFNPLTDSMRIYFVLLRFSFVSLLTALLDNGIFAVAFYLTTNILFSQILGRAGAVIFNYSAARRSVFLSRERHSLILPKYLALVLVSGAISYSLIGFLHQVLGWAVIPSKLVAEGVLFIANFCIQRDIVFRSQSQDTRTNWDKYYKSVPFTAKLTRKYTTSVLLNFLRRYGGQKTGSRIVEIGGANSCFVNSILSAVEPSEYTVIDNNEYGLELLRTKGISEEVLRLQNRNVLNLAPDEKADIVFSVGLIEHFDGPGTRKAIQAHFQLLKPGGYAIISFPTPTLLYRLARGLCEALGLWIFFDERPLHRDEVAQTMGELGTIVQEKTLWPLIFTQRVMVVKKEAVRQPLAGNLLTHRAVIGH